MFLNTIGKNEPSLCKLKVVAGMRLTGCEKVRLPEETGLRKKEKIPDPTFFSLVPTGTWEVVLNKCILSKPGSNSAKLTSAPKCPRAAGQE